LIGGGALNRSMSAEPPRRPTSAKAISSSSRIHLVDVHSHCSPPLIVTRDGKATLAGHQHLVGFAWAGRTITLRLDGHLMHAIADNALISSWPVTSLPRWRGPSLMHWPATMIRPLACTLRALRRGRRSEPRG
jgi:hypothetical protein